MKIAFVSTIVDYPWGGADFLWTRAAEAAADRGDTLLLAVSATVAEHPRVAALRARGATIQLREKETVPVTLGDRIGRRLQRLLGPTDAVAGALAKFRPDLVVFSCGATYDLAYFPAWVDWLLASRTPFRVIANWQLENPSLAPAEQERIVRAFMAADVLCFVSTRNLEVTRRHLGHALPNACVIHNPLRWQPADTTPWPASPPWQLATVSRLDAGKGVHLLLAAAATELPRHGDWRLTIHGRGPAEADLKEQASRLGLAGHVRFAGYVPDLRAIWENNHLMVSPSIEDGVPMTIPEALLCRRPVLTTAVGGAGDWVRDGVTGFVSPATTPVAFAKTLRTAWDQRSRWEAMGETGAAEAAARYRPDDYLQLIQR